MNFETSKQNEIPPQNVIAEKPKNIDSIKSPEKVEKSEDKILKPFTEGHILNVKRTSGEIENDWVLSAFDAETGNAIVLKKDKNGETLKKIITPEELETLNPPTEKPDFSEDFLSNRAKTESNYTQILKDEITNITDRRKSMLEGYQKALLGDEVPESKLQEFRESLDYLEKERSQKRAEVREVEGHIRSIEEKLAAIEKQKQEKEKGGIVENESEETPKPKEESAEKSPGQPKPSGNEQSNESVIDKVLERQKETSIRKAEDFRDLIVNVIPSIGDIKAPDGYVYPVQKLQEIINAVREDPSLIGRVTRALGLREKVQQLLNEVAEKIKEAQAEESKTPEQKRIEELEDWFERANEIGNYEKDPEKLKKADVVYQKNLTEYKKLMGEE